MTVLKLLQTDGNVDSYLIKRKWTNYKELKSIYIQMRFQQNLLRVDKVVFFFLINCSMQQLVSIKV